MSIHEDRHTGIGSTDAMRIMKGEWLELYEEKMGLRERVDLSDVFAVQLGILTEPFHIEWLRDKQGYDITVPVDDEGRPVRYSCDAPVPMFTHLDGLIAQRGHVEVKHTNQFATASKMVEYYAPQLHHVMHILGTDECLFSFIAGNTEPSAHWVRRNDEFMGELLEMERKFWWHIEQEIQPDPLEVEVPFGGHAFTIDEMKPYDMASSNAWADHAAKFMANKDAAVEFEVAKKELKALVPDDASRCFGHGVTITRDKRGALRFS